MMELTNIWFVVGLCYFSLIPTIVYSFDYIEQRYRFTLTVAAAAYATRIVLEASSYLVRENKFLFTIYSTLCIFLTLICLSIVVLTLYDQHGTKRARLFYSYAAISVGFIFVSPDTLVRDVVIIGLSAPYIGIILKKTLFESEIIRGQIWFLTRTGRIILVISILLIGFSEILMAFITKASYDMITVHLIIWVLALGLLHIAIILSSFKVTCYALNQLGLDYLFFTAEGQVLAASPNFQQIPPFNGISQDKQPQIWELSRIIDLDNLQNLKALNSFLSLVLPGNFNQQGEDETIILDIKTPDGTRSFMTKLVSHSMVSIEKFKIYMVLFEPITRPQEIMQDVMAGQVTSDYSRLIIHDIKNQLLTVSGYVALLEESLGSDETTQTSFEATERGLNEIGKLISELSTMAKQQKQILVFTEIRINLLLRAVIGHLKPFQRMKRIKLELSVQPPNAEFIIEGDRNSLMLALEIPLHNALKYSPEGSTVKIACSISHQKPSKDYDLIVKITDQGVGIPKDEQIGLFTPNFRASNVRDTSGQGIGLYHARRVVERHKGKLEVFSEGEDKGTTITIYFRGAKLE